MPQTTFDPATNGFMFANTFSNAIHIPGIGNVAFAAGRCGGMAFASLDYFHSSIAITYTSATPPDENTSLGQYILRRQIASFFVPSAVRFFQWSALPDQPALFIRPIADQSRDQELSKIRARIDANEPVVLGLVAARGLSISQLGMNHQVVATGYDALPDGSFDLSIYDVNYPGDMKTIRIEPSSPGFPERSADGSIVRTWRGFFVQDYYRQTPPADVTGIAAGMATGAVATAEKPLIATAITPRQLRITFEHLRMAPGADLPSRRLAFRFSAHAASIRWPRSGYRTIKPGKDIDIGASLDIDISALPALTLSAQLIGRDYRHLSAFGIAPAPAVLVLDPATLREKRTYEIAGSDNGQTYQVTATVESMQANARPSP